MSAPLSDVLFALGIVVGLVFLGALAWPSVKRWLYLWID